MLYTIRHIFMQKEVKEKEKQKRFLEETRKEQEQVKNNFFLEEINK